MAKKTKGPGYESYIASSRRAAKRRGRAVAVSAYKIEVRFLGGLTTPQKNAFKAAADRWAKVIVGSLVAQRAAQGAGHVESAVHRKDGQDRVREIEGQGPAEVPVENSGGAGTQDGHWRESVFRNELMSGFIAAPNNPLSRMTVGSLKDMGYTVDLTKAEAYKLPDLLAVAAAGEKTTHDHPHAIPVIPITLPNSNLIK